MPVVPFLFQRLVLLKSATKFKPHLQKSSLWAVSVTSSPSLRTSVDSGPLPGKFMVTFWINKGNWESLAHGKLSSHLSEAVKRSSPVASVEVGGPRARRETSFPQSAGPRILQVLLAANIHLSRAVNHCIKSRSWKIFISSVIYFTNWGSVSGLWLTKVFSYCGRGSLGVLFISQFRAQIFSVWLAESFFLFLFGIRMKVTFLKLEKLFSHRFVSSALAFRPWPSLSP